MEKNTGKNETTLASLFPLWLRLVPCVGKDSILSAGGGWTMWSQLSMTGANPAELLQINQILKVLLNKS